MAAMPVNPCFALKTNSLNFRAKIYFNWMSRKPGNIQPSNHQTNIGKVKGTKSLGLENQLVSPAFFENSARFMVIEKWSAPPA